MAARIRARVTVTGKVQGVYYRQNTMEKAKEHGVSGWVRNLPDGQVEAIFEGEEASVKKVLDWCRSGPPRAEVEHVETNFESYTGEFSDFVISY